MANDYDTTARNVGADAIAAACTRLALHSGDPGAANAADNELSGGSPAYARKAVAFSAASGGAAAQNGNVVFDVAAGSTVSWVSGWNTAGTIRYFKKDVTKSSARRARTPSSRPGRRSTSTTPSPGPDPWQ
jgi:hypothetical protein